MAGKFTEFTGVPAQCGGEFDFNNSCLRQWENKMSDEMFNWWNTNKDQAKKDKPE
jgi:hypothetical protein